MVGLWLLLLSDAHSIKIIVSKCLELLSKNVIENIVSVGQKTIEILLTLKKNIKCVHSIVEKPIGREWKNKINDSSINISIIKWTGPIWFMSFNAQHFSGTLCQKLSICRKQSSRIRNPNGSWLDAFWVINDSGSIIYSISVKHHDGMHFEVVHDLMSIMCVCVVYLNVKMTAFFFHYLKSKSTQKK